MGVIFAGVVLCLLVAPVVGIPAAEAATAGNPSPQASFGDISAEEFEADRTHFQITVFENGSAEWVFRYEQHLETDEEVEDFETYAERFNEEETESYRNFRSRATSLAETGSEVTDREMTAGTFRRQARVEERPPAGEEFAVIDMSFTWTGFAELDDDRVVVGDVFVDGLYVGPDQQLRFERGPTLRFDSVGPDPDSLAGDTVTDSETVTWVGEQQFTDRHPRIVYSDRDVATDQTESDSDTGTESESDTDTDTDTESDPETEGPSSESSADTGSFMPITAIALVLLLGSGAVIAYRAGILSRESRTKTATEGRTADATETPGTEATAMSASRSGGNSSVGGRPEISEEELLSDEERVVALLEERGGRTKQIEIVNNTDWSKSKVSMLLSEMEEEGTISKLRVGRENIVSLAGHEPDAARSPFDDED